MLKRFAWAVAGLFLLMTESSAQLVNPTNGHTYQNVYAYSLAEANGIARKRGGRIAVVRNLSESQWIGANFPFTRIGLTDETLEGNHLWLNNAPYLFRNWEPGQPDNAGPFGDEDEVVVRPNGQWSDFPAVAFGAVYLVEYPLFSFVNPTSGKIYVLGSPNMTITQMRSEAAAMGAHLATFDTPGEEFLVTQAMGPELPLVDFVCGLTDEASEGNFVWENGDAIIYTNWGALEPSNASANVDHVVVRTFGGYTAWYAVDGSVGLRRGLYEFEATALESVGFDGLTGGCGSMAAATTPPSPLESVSRILFGAATSDQPVATMPTVGSGYAYVVALTTDPANAPGGPMQNPGDVAHSSIAVGIPVGTIGIAIDWDFITGESQSSSLNDAMSIDVCDPSGQVLGSIAYADSFTRLFAPPSFYSFGANGCYALNGTPVALPIPKTATRAFVGSTGESSIPPGSFLNIVVRHGLIANAGSAAIVDNIRFVTRNIVMEMSAPSGPGSFRLSTRWANPQSLVYRAITVGTLPPTPGWFFGINITTGEIGAQLDAGYPFVVQSDATGSSVFDLATGVVPGIPLVGVAIEFTGSMPPIRTSSPIQFITP